jgi:hypothetical protein
MSGENDDQERAGVTDGEQQQAEVHEWSAFYDADGSLYYYNASSGESSWEAPEIFNPPPPREGEEQQEEGDSDLQQQELPDAQEQPSAEDEDPPEDGGLASPKHGLTDSPEPEGQGDGGADGSEAAWVAYKDDEGREYFFNTVTNETTWEQPETFVRAPEEEAEEEEDEFVGGRTPPGEDDDDDDGSTRAESLSPDRPSSPIPMDEYIPTDEEEGEDDTGAGATPDDRDEDEQAAEREPKEETINPAVKRLQDAEAALNTPDAIMEPGV